MSRHTVSETLRSLHVHGRNLPAFHQAGIGLWAVKAGRRDRGLPDTVPYGKAEFDAIAGAVGEYLLKDPLSDGLESTLLETMLRISASQFTFVKSGGDFGRAYVLWHKLPPGLIGRPECAFDFLSAFRETHAISPIPFLKICLLLFSAACNNNAFTGGYLVKAFEDGMKIPDTKAIRPVLDFIAGTPEEISFLANKHKCLDRRFAPYDFNPLLVRPIVRPWGVKRDFNEEGMIAPIPSLIEYRASAGVYYALFNRYKLAFSNYFGYLFESYVGEVLREFCEANLLSESDFKADGHGDRPTVDWVLRLGEVAVIIECKATSFNRTAQTTGASEAIDYSLKQVKKGIEQCEAFIEDLRSGSRKHKSLDGCSKYIPVVITWERMPLVNSKPMLRDFLQSANSLGLVILSVQDLELLEMYDSKGINPVESIELIRSLGYYEGFEELHNRFPVVHEDSFLSSYDGLLFDEVLSDHPGSGP